MTAPRGRPAGPWRSAGPELVIAAVVLVVFATAAFVWAGVAGAVVVVVTYSVIALAVTSRLLPARMGPPLGPPVPVGPRRGTSWFDDYWRLQMRLDEGTVSESSYQLALGPRLQHLLAARLSEHHGVNLYRQPEAARQLLCADPVDDDLWAWVDPDRQTHEQTDRPGIPPRALARLVRRLEQL